MPTSNNVGLWDEVGKQAHDRIMELAKEMIASSMGPDGSGYGDRPLSRGERILRFQMDAQMGALDILKVQSPDIYAQYVRDYLRDISSSPLTEA